MGRSCSSLAPFIFHSFILGAAASAYITLCGVISVGFGWDLQHVDIKRIYKT